jgi:hypothetical protein
MTTQYTNDFKVPWMTPEAIKTLPVFLVKLIRMLEDRNLDDYICWDRSGTSFHILDAPRFCDNVLPSYFKHRNLNSFVRQLNFYGFRKLAAADRATLTQIETPSDDLHFMHQKFIRGRPQLMYEIKRQTNPTKKLTAVASEKVIPTANNILDGHFVTVPQQEWIDTNNKLNDLQIRHDELQYNVETMDKSQHLLFDEIRILREMCKKQSDCFNKLMSYLVTMMNPAKRVRQTRPRPYVDHSDENFAISTRNGGDMLALIQKEFQEGLHISKQSVFDEGNNKDVHFEYYEPEYYDEQQPFDSLQNQEGSLPPTLERQNNQQLALTRPKQMYTLVSQPPKKEIQAPTSHLVKHLPTSEMSEAQPSTSYVDSDAAYGYYEEPLDFLEQRTPPAPGDSPLFLNKVEPIVGNPQYADENEDEEEIDDDMMDVFDGVPLSFEGDGHEWGGNSMTHV